MWPWFAPFVFAVVGSAGVELVKIVRTYESGKRFPVRYSRKGYWAVRICLALVGGIVAAFAYAVDNLILAIHIGASTPSILESFARSAPEFAAVEPGEAEPIK